MIGLNEAAFEMLICSIARDVGRRPGARVYDPQQRGRPKRSVIPLRQAQVTVLRVTDSRSGRLRVPPLVL